MSCERFVHTEEPDMDWVCVCGHDTDWHGMSPSNPGGPCAACAESPVAGCTGSIDGECCDRPAHPDCALATPYTEQETTNG